MISTIRFSEGFTDREPESGDIVKVVELINISGLHDTGKPLTDKKKKLADWESGELDIKKDCRIFTAADGKFVGYIEIWNGPPHTRPCAWGCVHPDYRNIGIGTGMNRWAEKEVFKALGSAPPGKRISFQIYADKGNPEAFALAEDLGFSYRRSFLGMEIIIDPENAPEEPALPENIRIRQYVFGKDDKILFETVNESFKDHWDHVERPVDVWLDWHIRTQNFKPEFFFLAVNDSGNEEEVVGAAVCFPENDGFGKSLYIDELAVLRPWRRKGIALSLLKHVFSRAYQEEAYIVNLDVDSENPSGAKHLYEKAGMKEVSRKDLYEKELRKGED